MPKVITSNATSSGGDIEYVQVNADWNATTGVSAILNKPEIPEPMTGTEILTALKTVDGSGSGLDADKLDGKESTEFSLSGHTHPNDHSPITVTDTTSIDLTLVGQELSASAKFGTTSGTVAQGNDTRFSDARTPLAHTHTKANITDFAHSHLNADLPPYPTTLPANGGNADTISGFTVGVNVSSDAKFTDTITTINGKTGVISKSDIVALGIPTSDTNTTYSAGTGLILTGTVFTPTFGSTVGTITQGNDTRLSDSRTPLAHNQTSSTITDFANTVRSTVLTGISLVTGTVISATDTVLVAFGKLQKQITDNLSTLTSHTGNTSNPHTVTKEQIGLGNVNNTTDALKPVSTATQTALNLKANLASPTLTGTPLAPTASVGTNTTQIATTAYVQTAMASAGAGDMLKSVYDIDGNGIVDRATIADSVSGTIDGGTF